MFDEVVHREEAQRADGIRAVRLVDGLGLEEASASRCSLRPTR